MIENNAKPESDVVCRCAGTSVEQIQALIDDGVTELERISRVTGACSGCGGCEFEIREMLKTVDC
ncbi:(2Fe-2S)-binding protein [Methylomonas sp. MgM2]